MKKVREAGMKQVRLPEVPLPMRKPPLRQDPPALKEKQEAQE